MGDLIWEKRRYEGCDTCGDDVGHDNVCSLICGLDLVPLGSSSSWLSSVILRDRVRRGDRIGRDEEEKDE